MSAYLSYLQHRGIKGNSNDLLMHYGVSILNGSPGRGSGRYPLGSGENANQRNTVLKSLAKGSLRAIRGGKRMAVRLRDNYLKRREEKRVAKMKSNPKGYSVEDINKRIQRLELEKRYRDLYKEVRGDSVVNQGKKQVARALSQSVGDVVKESATYLLGKGASKFINNSDSIKEAFGITDDVDVMSWRSKNKNEKGKAKSDSSPIIKKADVDKKFYRPDGDPKKK